MKAEIIARRLGGRRSGKGWICRCPAHNDRSPSLAITDKGDRTLVHCFSGCNYKDIVTELEKLGLWDSREKPADYEKIKEKEQHDKDQIFMNIYHNDLREGKKIQENDKRLYFKIKTRMKKYREKYGITR